MVRGPFTIYIYAPSPPTKGLVSSSPWEMLARPFLLTELVRCATKESLSKECRLLVLEIVCEGEEDDSVLPFTMYELGIGANS
uniref:Uncharacterized protein n=1 Tax=Podarcis muralis TaxID=64176 RepID=A0A670HSX7_PODMU